MRHHLFSYIYCMLKCKLNLYNVLCAVLPKSRTSLCRLCIYTSHGLYTMTSYHILFTPLFITGEHTYAQLNRLQTVHIIGL